MKIYIRFAMQIANVCRTKSITAFCSTWHRYMLLPYASPNLEHERDSVHRSSVGFVKNEEEVTIELSCRVVTVWGSVYSMQYSVMVLPLLPSGTAAFF